MAFNICGMISSARTIAAMGTETFGDFLNLLEGGGELVRVRARVSPILEIAAISDRMGKTADLTKLPIIQCWPLDGNLDSGQVFDKAAALQTTERGTGRYITLGGIYTKNPETGDRNIGMYRVQVFGPRKAAMHWHMHHDGARHFRMYQKRGLKMPLAIVLGGESVLPYAATAPLPPGIEELQFAGFLNNGGIELVKCKTIDLEVPANAEIVIEGYVDPNEKLLEGPFGDHTGFYSLADFY